MEIILSPSILAADFGRLGEQIKEADEAGAKYLHLDVMDGIFVPNISFGIPVIQSIRKYVNSVFDVHLMIDRPERYIDKFIDAGADIITFHAESTQKPDKCIEIIKSRGKLAAMAISPATGIDAVLPYADKLDMILCMTVEPGYGGQKYMPEIEAKVSELRRILGDSANIQVDGGITAGNIERAVNAGANIIVAGTSIFGGNIKENILELMRVCAQ